MKIIPINGSRFLSPKRITSLACSFAIVLAVAGWLVVLPLATVRSSAMVSALKAVVFGSTIPVQSQTSTLYLHGTGPVDNPPTLFLNTTAPTATSEKFKDSTSINRTGGNPWKEVGTWQAAPR